MKMGPSIGQKRKESHLRREGESENEEGGEGDEGYGW
jgi:hypothetical protein